MLRVDPAKGASVGGGPGALLEAFNGVLEGAPKNALLVTPHAAPWPAIDALLSLPGRLTRALAFYRSAESALADDLASGVEPGEALEGWISAAHAVVGLAEGHGRQVVLVDLDAAYRSTRVMLQTCAERFLFDTVDASVKAAPPPAPRPGHELAAEALLRQSGEGRALQARFETLAMIQPPARLASVEKIKRFVKEYSRLSESDQALEKAQEAVQALRSAQRQSDLDAGAFQSECGRLKSLLGDLAPGLDIDRATPADLSAYRSDLETELARLRARLGKIQDIAELQFAEAAELRDRLERLSMSSPEEKYGPGRGNTAAQPTGPPDSKSGPEAGKGPAEAGRAEPSVKVKPGLRERWRHRKEAKLVARSGLFDATWYMQTNSDLQNIVKQPLLHFVRHGGQEGRAPGPGFSSRRYLEEHRDVADAGLNQLVHYLLCGKSVGRAVHRGDES